MWISPKRQSQLLKLKKEHYQRLLKDRQAAMARLAEIKSAYELAKVAYAEVLTALSECNSRPLSDYEGDLRLQEAENESDHDET